MAEPFNPFKEALATGQALLYGTVLLVVDGKFGNSSSL